MADEVKAVKHDDETLEKMKAVGVQGARVFERIESASDRLADGLPKVRDVIIAGHALGMCGLMRRRRLLARVGKIQGMHAALDEAITALHEDCTAICDENGADLPQPRGGGSR